MTAVMLSGRSMKGFVIHTDSILKSCSNIWTRRRLPGSPEVGRKSDEWGQMFADVLQMPIEVTKSTELGALGAAICAAIGAGHYGSIDDAIAGMVKTTKVFKQDESKKAIYDKKYNRYLKAIDALDGYWE